MNLFWIVDAAEGRGREEGVRVVFPIANFSRQQVAEECEVDPEKVTLIVVSNT